MKTAEYRTRNAEFRSVADLIRVFYLSELLKGIDQAFAIERFSWLHTNLLSTVPTI